VADYHIHLLGPYALPLPDPLAPAVTLPDELARLLEDRARLQGNVNSVADLTPVFTADAQLLNAYVNPTGWLHDPEWFMRYINLWQATARIRYVPNAFAVAGNAGYIAGTVQDSASNQHVENFLIGIRQGQDGRWRIAAESSTRKTAPRFSQVVTAQRLIADLDEAGIQRAVVLSVAFWLGANDEQRRMTPVADGRLAVQMENDWTAAQVAQYPDRLVMACSVTYCSTSPSRSWCGAQRCLRSSG
jgi:ketosteroid isomerase-like protein